MFEKLKGFVDLKAIMMVCSIIVTMVTAYNTIGQHTTTLQKHDSFHIKHFETANKQERDLALLQNKVDAVVTRQNGTDSRLEALTTSIQKLNETMIKLTTLMEAKK